jgi:hypothetical protein
MSFSTDFPDGSIIDALGDDITYTAGVNPPVDIKAIVNFNVTQNSYNGEFLCEMEFLKTAVAAVARGDSVEYLTTTYTVDSIINDDGKFIRVGVIG